MRIVVLLSSLYTGGAEFSTLKFYGWLKKQYGYDITLVVYKTASPAFSAADFGLDDEVVLGGTSFRSKLKEFNGLMARLQPKLLHSILFNANMIGRCYRMTHRSTVHLESLVNETYSPHRLNDPRVTRVKLLGYRLLDTISQFFGVDHFHANGQAVASHYKEKLFISADRLDVITRGREPNQFVNDVNSRNQVRRKLGLGDEVVFIQVARHEYQKGQDILLSALATLGTQLAGVKVVVVGREGHLTSQLTQFSKDHQMEATVLWLGHRNDVPQLLAASDVFVFPSRYEGFPGALVEAEASALPILCSDIPGNREVAAEGRNAFYFSLDDKEQLAGLILRLKDQPELRRRMGDESLAIFDANFTIDHIHIQMKALVDRLVASR